MIRIGLFTDVHYAKDMPDQWSRTCSKSLDKVRKILSTLNDETDVYFQLGDLINSFGDEVQDQRNIAEIMKVLADNPKPCYCVVGNHDADVCSKLVFVPGQEKPYYFLDLDGVRFIVLDANFASSGMGYDEGKDWDWKDSIIPEEQIVWLKKVLDEAEGKAVVICHENLDERGTDPHLVKNRAEVRRVMEESGKVPLVLQGHCHTGCRQVQNGIDYFTLRALCEKDGIPCAVLTVDGDDMRIEEKELSGK